MPVSAVHTSVGLNNAMVFALFRPIKKGAFADTPSQPNEGGANAPSDVNFVRDERGNRLLLVDDGSHMLAMKGTGDIPFHHAVDDLHLFYDLTVLDYFQTGALDDQVILILVK